MRTAYLFSLALIPAVASAETFMITYHAPADRALAAAWLGKMKSAKALPLLRKLCDDADGGVQTAAVEALGRLGDPGDAGLLEKLAADPKRVSVLGARLFNGA